MGSAVALMGLVIPPIRLLYDYSWFVGFVVAFAVYWALMGLKVRKVLADQGKEPHPANWPAR
jgi:NCS1 family nucleobase:cation symporter-1